MCLTFNPIATYQAFSYYIDGQLYSLMLIMFCFLLRIYLTPNRTDILVTCLTIAYLINIKFTALVYCIIFIFFLLVIFYLKNNLQKTARLTAYFGFTILIGTFLFGYNPYATNIIKHHHPFYPLMGEGAHNIMDGNKPASVQNLNRLSAFTVSLFSTAYNGLEETELKIPFTTTINELMVYANSDTRLNGFGPFFSGLFILTTCFLFSILISRRTDLKNTLFIFAGIFILFFSVFLNPEAWWARYVPQLWLYPIIIGILLLRTSIKAYNISGKVLIILCLFNTLIVGSISLLGNIVRTQKVQQQLVFLENNKDEAKSIWIGPFIPLERRINERTTLDIKPLIKTKFCEKESRMNFYGTWSESKICFEENAKLKGKIPVFD